MGFHGGGHYVPVWVCLIALAQVFAYELGVREYFVANGRVERSVWTYAFSHLSVMHLVGNVATLLYVGLSLEVHDGIRVVPVWFGGVVGGAICHAVYYGSSSGVGLAGGSAGVYGVVLAHFAAIAFTPQSLSRSVYSAAMYAALCAPPIAEYVVRNRTMSHAAHLGGALGGLCVGFVCLKNYHRERGTSALRTTALRIMGWVGIAALCTLGISGLHRKTVLL